MSDIHLAGVHCNTIIRFHLANFLCISLFAINNTFPALQPPILLSFFFKLFTRNTPMLQLLSFILSSPFIFSASLSGEGDLVCRLIWSVFFKINGLKDSAKRRRFQKCLSNATWQLLESRHTISDCLEKSRRRKMIPKQDSGLLRNCLALMFCYNIIIFVLCEY